MRLLLVRHGESSANAEGRLQGHLDFTLSERGRRESERLADHLARLPIAALYTSPLRRARETAEIIAGRIQVALVERPALMERDVGELAGLSPEEMRAQHPQAARAREGKRADMPVAGYESDDDLARRVMEELGAITHSHPQQTVAVVTHAGVITTFCRQSLGVPMVWPGPFAIANASITTFDLHDGEPDPRLGPRVQLVALNDSCHLGTT